MRLSRNSTFIDLDALRIGMFVRLDLNWMSHPFPLSSFKISSLRQVETMRSLGLKQVRWVPEQSDPEGEHAATSTSAGALTSDFAAAPNSVTGAFETSRWTDEGNNAVAANDESKAEPPSATRATVTATSQNRSQQRRQRLEAQRSALRLCERQYDEAARACKHTTDLVLIKPQEAREQAEGLTTALLEKMLVPQEVCIRLLSDGAGNKASMHAMNVMLVSLLMGRSFGFSQADLLDLGVGAMLHDIGKIEMPFRLRHRDDHFSASEQRDYEEHVAHGLALARRMGLSPGATLVLAQHHEHADGSGFPLKLNSDTLTIGARIVALVNRYDNLCNPNFMAKALTPHEAISLLFTQGSSKFDTSILGAFIRMMGVYPPGSTVQLTDDRYAMVMSVNSSRPLKPNVMVYDSAVPREDAFVLDLEQAQGIGIRRSIKPTQLPPPAIEYLGPRQRVAYFFEPAAVAERRA